MIVYGEEVVESFVNRLKDIGFEEVKKLKLVRENCEVTLKVNPQFITLRIKVDKEEYVRLRVKYEKLNNTWPSIVGECGRVSLRLVSYRYTNENLLVRPFTGLEVTLYD